MLNLQYDLHNKTRTKVTSTLPAKANQPVTCTCLFVSNAPASHMRCLIPCNA